MSTDANTASSARTPTRVGIVRLAVPFAVMALVWWFSSRPGAGPSPDAELGRFLQRKLAHVVLFGVLWASWWFAFKRRLALAAAVLAIGYGAVDEVHQHTVPGRTGTVRDVAIDALGVALAIIAARAWQRSADRS